MQITQERLSARLQGTFGERAADASFREKASDMRLYRRILQISVPVVFLGCSSMGDSKVDWSVLEGSWEYVECAIKNTSVKGTLTFESGRFVFDGRIRQDYPTHAFREEYEFSLQGAGWISYKPDVAKEPPPVFSYFLIDGDYLYFSEYPMDSVLDDRLGPYRKTNWQYKLRRI